MKKNKFIKIFKIIFIVYCIVLIYILFLCRSRVGNVWGIKTFSKEHIDGMTNFIPFVTIKNYYNHINSGILNSKIIFENLVANILMFIPMGILLPILYKDKFNKLWKILLFIIVLVLLIEFIQFVTFTGSADVDDLTLNTLGCLIGYSITKIKSLRKFLHLD